LSCGTSRRHSRLVRENAEREEILTAGVRIFWFRQTN